MEEKEQLKIFSNTIANKYSVYLNEVKEAIYFNDFFNTIQNSHSNDVIDININSFGGFEESAIQLYNELINCKAHVHINVSGYCCSAGSVVLLTGDTWSITKNSKVMVHSPKSWFGGKHNELLSRVDFEKEWVKDFFKEVYKGFLTDKEIKEALDGKDFWFNGNETVKRLQKIVKGKK